MGQRQSRQSYTSTSSEAALKGIWSPRTTQTSDSPHSVSNITRPDQPQEITRLSALIDPEEIRFDWTIRSPSGNLLGPAGFFSHPARPLSIRERQERVKAVVGSYSSAQLSNTTVGMEGGSTTNLQALRAPQSMRVTGSTSHMPTPGITNNVYTAGAKNMQAGESSNIDVGSTPHKIERNGLSNAQATGTSNAQVSGTRTRSDTNCRSNNESGVTMIRTKSDRSTNIKSADTHETAVDTSKDYIAGIDTITGKATCKKEIEAIGADTSEVGQPFTVETGGTTKVEADVMASNEAGYTNNLEASDTNKVAIAGDIKNVVDEKQVQMQKQDGKPKKFHWLLCCFDGGVE